MNVIDKTGTYNLAYMISAALLVVAFGLAIIIKPLKVAKETQSLGEVAIAES